MDEVSTHNCIDASYHARVPIQDAHNLHRAEKLAADMIELGTIIQQQLPLKNQIWLRGILSQLGTKVEPAVHNTLAHIHTHEKNGKGRTWPRNARESRASASTMGYHIINNN